MKKLLFIAVLLCFAQGLSATRFTVINKGSKKVKAFFKISGESEFRSTWIEPGNSKTFEFENKEVTSIKVRGNGATAQESTEFESNGNYEAVVSGEENSKKLKMTVKKQ